MEVIIESLQSGNWIAWAGLLLGLLLLLVFTFKCIVKIGKIFFILLIAGAVLYGVVQLFPEQTAPLVEKLQAFWPESGEVPAEAEPEVE